MGNIPHCRLWDEHQAEHALLDATACGQVEQLERCLQAGTSANTVEDRASMGGERLGRNALEVALIVFEKQKWECYEAPNLKSMRDVDAEMQSLKRCIALLQANGAILQGSDERDMESKSTKGMTSLQQFQEWLEEAMDGMED
eukprot:TRINITY_DN2621_c0_g1_i1.p1 TRINITY_DN2621_c0_g1~~TRINITY_DN2621_c0_g1_i1.p1  ORF type:complete len:143 (-),score=34.39 TRINITY_DN2621_c0_g1_i1:250-678(-)